MSKYDALREYIRKDSGSDDEIRCIVEIPLDHSLLDYKKELSACGYTVGKIFTKAKTVSFIKMQATETDKRRSICHH